MSGAAATTVIAAQKLPVSPSASRQASGRLERLGPACAAAAVGGLLLATAFEPFGWTIGMLVGPACLMVALQGRTTRASLLVGFVFGVAFQGVLLVWLAESMGYGAWVALTLVQACWFGVLGLFVRLLSVNRPGNPGGS